MSGQQPDPLVGELQRELAAAQSEIRLLRRRLGDAHEPAEAGPHISIVGAAFRRPDQERPPPPYSSDVHAQYPAVECYFPL